MDSFTAPACPDQPGSQRSRANNTSEQQLRLLLAVTKQFVFILDLRNLVPAISSTIRRLVGCNATGMARPEVSLSSIRRCVGSREGSRGSR
jgi:hypothetical protein